jgi:hypothetical protein
MSEFLTDQKRSELNRAINSRAVRVAVYDVGILIGLLFAADQSHSVYPNYTWLIQASAIGMWASMVFSESATGARLLN